MKRTLTFILCLAPTLPALALLALWPRSLFWRTDFFGYSTNRQAIGILSARGMLRIEHFNNPFDSPGLQCESHPADGPGFWSAELPQIRGPLASLRIGTRRIPYNLTSAPETRRSLYIPHWAAALIAAIPAPLSLLLLRRHRRRSRLLRGLCPTCGYDLRATPSRCPECGRQPPHSGPAPRLQAAIESP